MASYLVIILLAVAGLFTTYTVVTSDQLTLSVNLRLRALWRHVSVLGHGEQLTGQGGNDQLALSLFNSLTDAGRSRADDAKLIDGGGYVAIASRRDAQVIYSDRASFERKLDEMVGSNRHVRKERVRGRIEIRHVVVDDDVADDGPYLLTLAAARTRQLERTAGRRAGEAQPAAQRMGPDAVVGTLSPLVPGLPTIDVTAPGRRLGRATHNLQGTIDVGSVSRDHAEIGLTRTANGWQIVDLGSLNGTFVNGAKVDAYPLADGDVIGLGPHVEFVWRVPPSSYLPTV